jgi:hypothetical protein
MRTAKTMTRKQAGEVKALLARRLRETREDQKRTGDYLRDRLKFWISEFEQGLTPAGFDRLVAERRIRIVG